MVQLSRVTAHKNLLLWMLIILYFLEGVNKYFIFYHGLDIVAVKAIKALFFLIAFVEVLFTRSWKKINLCLIFFICAIFAIGQLTLDPNFNTLTVINFSRYLFPLVLFTFYSNIELSDKKRELLLLIFERVVLLNSSLIIIGYLLDIQLFKSYSGSRFGYNGLLVSSATSTYFYSLTLFYFIVKYKSELFKSPVRLFVILTITLVGTKSLYVFSSVALFVYAIYYVESSKKIILYFLSLTLFVFFVYFFLLYSSTFRDITKSDGIVASLTSYRSTILLEEMIPFIKTNWTTVNYLFGGINKISGRPQMALFDLFYFIGIIGSSTYLYTYYRSFFIFNLNVVLKSFFLAIFVMACFTGNFFINTSVVVYLLVIREAVIGLNKNFIIH